MIEEYKDDNAPADDEARPEKEPVHNHCPFGCTLEDLDERGYCRHLIGFTNDKKMYEPCVPMMRRTRDEDGNLGPPEPTGNYRVLGRKHQVKPIPPKAKLVNLEERQFVQGIWVIAKKWVSWRVYAETMTVLPTKTENKKQAG